MVPNCAGCIAAASQNVAPTSESNTIKQQKAPKNGQIGHCSPMLNKSQPIMVAVPQNCQQIPATSTVEQTVVSVAHRRHSTPSIHTNHSDPNVEALMSPDDDGTQSLNPQDPSFDMDDSDVSLDDIDPNNL